MIFELQFDSQNAAGLARNHRAKLRGISDESLLRANQVCNILLLITVNAAGARTRQMRPKDQERLRAAVYGTISKAVLGFAR